MGRLACRLQGDTSAFVSTGLESGYLIWMWSCSADVMRLRTRKAMLEGVILNTFRRLHLAVPAFWFTPDDYFVLLIDTLMAQSVHTHR